MNDTSRLSARLIGHVHEVKVKHYHGTPPLAGGNDTRVVMERAAFLVIEEKPDGVFLYRYTSAGQVVGDTWHVTVDDAKEQARYEYGELISTWESIPPDIKDVLKFVISGQA